MNYNDLFFMSGNEEDGEGSTALAEDIDLQEPKMYQVLMHNDDYSTMEFVIHVLQKFFKKNFDEAHGIMLKVHHDGIGVCGIYTFEVAESKASKVNKYSKNKGHPLKCSINPCDN